MNVIILAAGTGTRFGIDIPKSLLFYKNKRLIEHLVDLVTPFANSITVVSGYQHDYFKTTTKQLNIKLLFNNKFSSANNIESLKLALLSLPEDNTLILEGDCYWEELDLTNLASSIIFFANETDGSKNNYTIKDKKIDTVSKLGLGGVDMAGAIFLTKQDLCFLKPKIVGATEEDLYYFEPMLGDIERFSFKKTSFKTFNLKQEYLAEKVDLFPVSGLHHIERWDPERVKWLQEKIEIEQVWTRPICIDDKHGLVMDGQHRFEVAKKMGLKYIPIKVFSYNEIEFKSLNDSVVTYEKICKATIGEIYPYKTVGHTFPEIKNVNLSLKYLKSL